MEETLNKTKVKFFKCDSQNLEKIESFTTHNS